MVRTLIWMTLLATSATVMVANMTFKMEIFVRGSTWASYGFKVETGAMVSWVTNLSFFFSCKMRRILFHADSSVVIYCQASGLERASSASWDALSRLWKKSKPVRASTSSTGTSVLFLRWNANEEQQRQSNLPWAFRWALRRQSFQACHPFLREQRAPCSSILELLPCFPQW